MGPGRPDGSLTPETHWRGPAAIVNDRHILSSEGILNKNYDRKCSVEKYTGRDSQGARRQGKLTADKPPVVK
jgi:hypothetical protein